jgi:DNA-binding transcriptional ArsR family regulator
MPAALPAAAEARALACLADPTRRAILDRLRRGPAAVGEIARGLPVSRPAVSQHLRRLEGAGLVRAERRGTRRVFRVELRGLAALRAYLDRLWDDALAAFARSARAGAGAPGAPRRPRRRRRP